MTGAALEAARSFELLSPTHRRRPVTERRPRPSCSSCCCCWSSCCCCWSSCCSCGSCCSCLASGRRSSRPCQACHRLGFLCPVLDVGTGRTGSRTRGIARCAEGWVAVGRGRHQSINQIESMRQAGWWEPTPPPPSRPGTALLLRCSERCSHHNTGPRRRPGHTRCARSQLRPAVSIDERAVCRHHHPDLKIHPRQPSPPCGEARHFFTKKGFPPTQTKRTSSLSRPPGLSWASRTVAHSGLLARRRVAPAESPRCASVQRVSFPKGSPNRLGYF